MGRAERGKHGGSDSHRGGDDDGPETDRQSAGEGRGSQRFEQFPEPEGQGVAAGQPGDGGHGADHQCFEDHRSGYLAGRGPQYPEQGQLSDPLAEHDGKRVVDDEGADQHGDHREGQQHVGDDVDERSEVVTVLFGDGRRVDNLQPDIGVGGKGALQVLRKGGEDARRFECCLRLGDLRSNQNRGESVPVGVEVSLDLGGHRCRVGAVFEGHVDLVIDALAAQERLGGALLEPGHSGPG